MKKMGILCEVSYVVKLRYKEIGMKQKLPIDITKVDPKELAKYEMAKELGLYERVIEQGWGALSARETGKIGGMLARRKKKGVE